MTRNLWRTPSDATDPWVDVVMKVLGILFGFFGLRSLVPASRQVKLLFEGGFAPHTIKFGVLLALTILFNLAFLNTGWLLFKSRTAGIRWGFVCLGLEASLFITGRLEAIDLLWVVGAAFTLWWCSEQIVDQPATR